MTYIDIEAKRLAMLQGLATHKASIEAIKKQILNTTSISFDSAFDMTKEIELYSLVINSMQPIIESEVLDKRAVALLQAIEERFEILNKRIRTSVYEKIKTAKLVDRSSGDLTNTFSIDITPSSFIADETSSLIEGGKIIGTTAKGNGNVTLVSTEWLKDITAQIDENELNVYATIAKRIANGWTVATKEELLNINGDYLIKCETSTPGNKKITLNIDLGRGIDIEGICPVFDNVEIIKIYTSSDNKVFNLLTGKAATINTTFTTPKLNCRYIKIVIFKDKESYKFGTKYLYETKLSQIKISHEYEKVDTVFVSKNIAVNQNISKISIDSDDSLKLSEYYISINDGEWRQIRPTGWSNNRDIPSVLKSQEIFENQIIEMTNSVKTIDGFLYDVDLPQPFLISNKTKILTDRNIWQYEEDRYSAYVLNYADIEIDTGTKEIYVDGETKTGVVTIKKGLSRVGIKAEDFVNLFNRSLIDKFEIDGALVKVTLRDGTVSNITDTMYPYNLKLIVEDKVNFLFGKELIEGKEFRYVVSGTQTKISTERKREAVYCIFYNLYTLVNDIKIKGVVKSNNTSISETSRIILRTA